MKAMHKKTIFDFNSQLLLTKIRCVNDLDIVEKEIFQCVYVDYSTEHIEETDLFSKITEELLYGSYEKGAISQEIVDLYNHRKDTFKDYQNKGRTAWGLFGHIYYFWQKERNVIQTFIKYMENNDCIYKSHTRSNPNDDGLPSFKPENSKSLDYNFEFILNGELIEVSIDAKTAKKDFPHFIKQADLKRLIRNTKSKNRGYLVMRKGIFGEEVMIYPVRAIKLMLKKIEQGYKSIAYVNKPGIWIGDKLESGKKVFLLDDFKKNNSSVYIVKIEE